MPDLSRLLGDRRLLLAAGVTVIVGALVVTLALVRPWASDQPAPKTAADVAPPAAGDRLLQSVDVAMQSDGSLDRVGDTVVISRGTSGAADSYATAYDPSTVVDQLPVRVVPSYRTAQSAGTNLADLKGYTGRVTIDLAVQNLTVRPQQVSYDVGGRSRTTTAMVGAPLTVVASAALPGVDPGSVVTAAADADATAQPTAATNGVLSRAADQTTQVQWATILAPPQLSSTATLRLVVDAKDFAVPTIDLSLQPGLVTDPSVGALVDAAFNPKNSDELALQSRTIDVIGDVNQVVTRASNQISKVRKTLDTTSQTLGAKTVVALQQDTKQIDASLKESDANLDALDKALQSSLKSTSSATVSRLASTVEQIDALLGDTSATAPRPTVTGEGCTAKVSAPQSGGSLYGSLLQVTAQLEAYAATTQGCKAELQRTILTTIGPADPTAENACPTDADVTSVTCALNAVRSSFSDVVLDIETAQKVSATLDPAKDFASSRADVDTLTDDLTEIVKSTDELLAEDPEPDPADVAGVTAKLAAAGKALTEAGEDLAAVKAVVDRVHAAALDNAEVVGTPETEKSIAAQNQALADQLCAVVGSADEPGKLPAEQVEQLRAFLVATSCPDANGATVALPPPNGFPAPMSARLEDQRTRWNELAADTDSTTTDDGLGKALDDTAKAIQAAGTAIKDAGTELGDDDETLTAVNETAKKALALLEGVPATTEDPATPGLAQKLAELEKQYTDAKKTLDAALADADDKAKTVSTTNLDSAIATVAAQGQVSSDQLGKAFENSAAGLSSAAQALQQAGATAIGQQRTELDRAGEEAGRSLTAATTGSLDQISGNVDTATRDLASTRTQLTRDLNNVLLDLGSPSVPGSGVIGTVAKGATAAGSADFQLALAADQTSAYAAVRGQDVAGILLRQAQAEAALARQAQLPAFELDVPDTVQHRTVYTFHLAGGR